MTKTEGRINLWKGTTKEEREIPELDISGAKEGSPWKGPFKGKR